MRINILLACEDCKRRNYATQKNKKNTTVKVELSKFCPFCGKHTFMCEQKRAKKTLETGMAGIFYQSGCLGSGLIN